MRKWGWMAAGGLLLAVAVGVVPAAPAGPLRVAFLGPLSGPFAFWGTNARDGMRMAVEELNAAGGVLGRPVELVERDDRNNPAEAISLFRSLAEREGIVAAAGTISSDIGTALAREADQLQVPVFLVRAGAHTILKKTSRYTFRTCLVASPMYVQASAALIQYAKYTRVGAIIADYAWGRSYMQWLDRFVRSVPGMQIQIEVAPVATSDFTPYLRRLQGFNPQFLDIGGHPPGIPVIVRQAAELGFRQQMFGAHNPPEWIVQRAGEAALRGPEEPVRQRVAVFQARRDLLVDGLREAGWRVGRPRATFYLWAEVPEGFDSVTFAQHVLERAAVVVTPGVGYGEVGDRYVRLSFTTPEDRLKEAVQRLRGLR